MKKGCLSLLIAIALVFMLAACDGSVKSNQKTLTALEAEETLTAFLTRVKVTNAELRRDISGMELSDLGAALPDIIKYPLSVTGNGAISIEIMSSTEKAGPGMDGWLNTVAEAFNAGGVTLASGKRFTVSIRPVASGLALDYIVTGRHVPDVYSPANALWGEMGLSVGAPMELVETRLVGNTAGLLMSKAAYDRYISQYGEMTLNRVIDAVTAGDLLLGYTNPYVSSTGLNALVSMLHAFDPSNPLSAEATAKLMAFQALVPPVAYTTAQMRESAKSGVVDAMVMEYQAFINEPSLKDSVFSPFGVRHDSPVYITGRLSDEQREGLSLFLEYCKGEALQQDAIRFGFNANDDYAGETFVLKGGQLYAAQQIWKENKDGGRPVVAVFVADVSGSMGGTPIANLQRSLLNASQYIGASNYIGLVSYATNVQIELPVAEFNGVQKACFSYAIKNLEVGGNTATYDAVLVGLRMLLQAKKDIPDAKLMLFVLSDGEQNTGYELKQITPVVQGLGIPIYTIGYNANITELESLSKVNEAVCINADESDVVYKLRDFFNAQM